MDKTVVLKDILTRITDENIVFTQHFYEHTQERPISEELVKKTIKKPETLLKAEKRPVKIRGEKKFRAWFKLSNKYSLVLIVAYRKKSLYIVTGWNTDRKWQKSVQK